MYMVRQIRASFDRTSFRESDLFYFVIYLLDQRFIKLMALILFDFFVGTLKYESTFDIWKYF